MSGELVDALVAANPEYVTLIDGGLRVSLPTRGLEDLGLNAGDSFDVVLEDAADGSVYVGFFVSGEQVEWSYEQPYLADRRDAAYLSPAFAPGAAQPHLPAEQADWNGVAYVLAAGMAGLCIGAGPLLLMKLRRK